LKNCDLSWSDLRQWEVEGCIFDGVAFSEANLGEWRDRRTTFTRCRFDRTRFVGSGLGYQGSRYIGCHFLAVDFRKVVFARPEFLDCIFENCRFNGVDFFASSFARCRFVGEIRDAWFRGGYPHPDDEADYGPAPGNRMEDVDFSEASLRWVSFSDGCDLTTCKLPAHPMTVRYEGWPQVLTYTANHLESLPEAERPTAKRFIDADMVDAGRGQADYVLNFEDLAEETKSPALAEHLRALLDEAVRASSN
jgi:fluoroquinolone resistance protein